MKLSRLIPLFLVALLLLPAAATAHHSGAYTRTHAALHRAYSYWGKLPPCGVPQVRFVPIPHHLGYAPPNLCEIWLSSTANWTYAKLCVIAVHEWGHRLGRRHSTDPHSIMYPRITRFQYRVC